MSEPTPSSAGALPLSLEMRLDQACDRFEAAWRAGQRPSLEGYLAGAGEQERPEFFRVLVKLELDLRRGNGEKPTAEEYNARFPGHLSLIQDAFASTFVEDQSIGEQEDVPTPEPADPVPAQVGRYQVRRRIGEGTFGYVYLAYDEVMDREVAIKVPRLRFMATAQARELFLAEARKAARFQHEGIVRAHDFGEGDAGLCFIVYEYVEGTSLAKRAKRSPLPHREAARIVAQAAEALHCAHLQGLVHRDIKPANILLDQRGKPRLTDFGLAVGEEELPGQKGFLAGTLPYMSPEQVRREGHLMDGRTDIYGLGVVLYELLCGRCPFEARAQKELVDQILQREPRPPRQIKDSIPRELEQVCLKALSKRVQDRYATAKDMAEELFGAVGSMADPDRQSDTAIPLEEIARRMATADAEELRRLLRLLQQSGDPACVPLVFRCLAHNSEAVREQARRAVRALGWDKVSAAAEDLARGGDAAGIAPVLDGLAAFEAHAQVVGLLDRLVVPLTGDLRNRTILLLERKRLGLELEAVACLFRDVQSPYRIEKVLGQGLFTAAYLARAEATELQVVVRVLRPEFAGQPRVRAEFLDLSKRALHVVHENVVLTRETRAFPERNIYFAVRDYVDGVTLQRLLEGGKRFEPAQAVQLLRQLLAALGAVHRRGMCHGGVKPSNVFLCAEDRVVLGDPSLLVRGIGVALERLSYDYRYAAPETFRGSGTVGLQSDFYALGCVAYELACGAPPFVSDNYLELAALHVHEAIAPPSRRGSRLGPAGDAVLMKLLARSPAERYANVDDVLRALTELEVSWKPAVPEAGRPAAPLVHDASLAHYRGSESVVGFDASAASVVGDRVSGTRDVPEESALARELPDPAHPPAQIGNYDIIETLGRGGMGVVYKARDQRLDRVVALKVLPSRLVDQAQRYFGGASPFLREARAVARLQHPNIVQIYEIAEHQGLPYLSLEFVGGGSLAQKLHEEKTLEPRAAAELIAKLARAVHHAHEQGVLHRDLKPSNVLLTPDEQPKIADFGLAKLLGPLTEDVYPTMEGVVLGTPAYMAPEQAAGDIKAVGPAADVYSLGVILYESLTGQRPFWGDNVMATLSRLATQPASPPSLLNSAVDRALDAICLKCLEKEPARRYPSAAALADDLDRWLRDEPITAARAGKAHWLRRFMGLFSFHRRG